MPLRSRVLVADDEPMNRELLQALLSADGVDVDLVDDGPSAVIALLSRSYDLVLLDVRMPGVDGFETCRRIRSHPHLAAVPVVFISAVNDAPSLIDGRSVGCQGFVGKPFDRRELLDAVAPFLHRSASEAAPDEPFRVA